MKPIHYLLVSILIASVILAPTFANTAGTNIIITEVLYDAPSSDATEEWIELYNPTSSAIDVTGWTLSDNAGSFGISGTIAAGGYLVIARDAAAFNALYGYQPDISGSNLALSNSGDQVILRDQSSTEVDFVAWENYVTGWSVSAVNLSIRRATGTDTDQGTDWENSGTLGDPGFGSYGPSVPDTTAPVVTITSPTDAAIVSGSVTISMSVSDASPITTNEIYVDGVLRSSTSSYFWDTTTETDATHTILAKAMDSSNNWGQTQITVTVDNTNYVPPVGGQVKVMLYNVEQSGLNADWKQVVKEENADIAIFVETGDWDTNGVFEAHIAEFNTYFTAEAPYVGAQTTGIAFSTSGEAVMSRYTILSVNQIPLVTLDDGTSFDPSHDFLDVAVDVSGTQIHIIAAHLKCCSGALNEDKRERAQEGIMNYIDGLGNVPVIYAGDLNSFSPQDVGALAPNGDLNYGPMSMVLKDDTFGAYSQFGSPAHTFVDTFRTLNPTVPGYTYGHQNPIYTSRIDFLNVNQFLSDKMISATVGDTPTANTGSDHYSTDVILDFSTSNTTDTTPPSQVTGLSATTVSSSQVDLNWFPATDDVGVDHYNLYRDNIFQTVVGTTSFSDTGLLPATTYNYEVAAVDLAGNVGLRSTIVSATTNSAPDTTAPSQVTGLSATTVSNTQIDLSWSAATDNVGVTGYKVYRAGVYQTTVTTTSFSDIGLSGSTTYSYTVSAIDAAGNEGAISTAASATTNANPDTTAPSQVTGLSATTVSTSQIDLSWSVATDNVGVTGYKIYRAGVYQTTVTTTSFSDIGLSGSTTYSYTVSAIDAAGNEGALSTAASATTNTNPDTTAPSQVIGLTATTVSNTQIDLLWSAATDNVAVTGYKIYRDGVYQTTVTTTSFSDTGLSGSTTYSYTVSAIDAAGNEGALSTAASATTNANPDTTAPSQVTGLSAITVSNTQIDLSWSVATDNVGVTGYKVYRDGFYLTTVTTTSFSDIGLSGSTTYSYTVSAIDAAGNEGALSTAASATTNANPDTTAPSQVTGLSATTVSTSQIDLSWSVASDNVGVTGYKIYRDGVYLTTVTTTSFSDIGLSGSTTYSYTVSAIDAAGNEGALSTAASATTNSIPDTTAPSQVAGLSATTIGTSQIDLLWSAATDNVGVTGYKIFRDGVYLTTVTTTSFSDTGLTSATTYSYTVSAFDAAGNNGALSTAASATTDTIPSGPVTDVFTGTVSSTTTDQIFYFDVGSAGDIIIDLSWAGSSDLDFYLYAPGSDPNSATGYLVRAYTLSNPESLTYAAVLTGQYAIRVNFYSGSTTSFTLTVTHPAGSGSPPPTTVTDTFTGTVSSTTTDQIFYFDVGSAGVISILLSWSTTSDLDFYLYAPGADPTLATGYLKRAYTTANPESMTYTATTTGQYAIRVNFYSGVSSSYTMDVTHPPAAAVLGIQNVNNVLPLVNNLYSNGIFILNRI